MTAKCMEKSRTPDIQKPVNNKNFKKTTITSNFRNSISFNTSSCVSNFLIFAPSIKISLLQSFCISRKKRCLKLSPL